MKTMYKLAAASVVGLALSSTAIAAQQPLVVAELLKVNGKVFVENVDGTRQVARKGMQITEGSSLMTLEKSKITITYMSSDCKITHQQNTLLTVQAAEQCGTGHPMAVGAAGATAIPPKTVAAGKVAKVSPIMKGIGATGSGSLGAGAGAAGGSLGALGAGVGAAGAAASLLPLGLGLLAAGALYQAAQDDDDPVSP